MICVDSSSLISFLEGEKAKDVELVEGAIVTGQLLIAPPAVTELLSSTKISIDTIKLIGLIPLLHMEPGYWTRAGMNRAKIRHKGLKASLADSLIAQSCIDNDVPLITRDEDFRHFAKYCGLRLAV